MSFKAVEKSISKKEGIPMKNAGAILANSSRNASPAAKKKNPKLKKVKGSSKAKSDKMRNFSFISHPSDKESSDEMNFQSMMESQIRSVGLTHDYLEVPEYYKLTKCLIEYYGWFGISSWKDVLFLEIEYNIDWNSELKKYYSFYILGFHFQSGWLWESKNGLSNLE